MFVFGSQLLYVHRSLPGENAIEYPALSQDSQDIPWVVNYPEEEKSSKKETKNPGLIRTLHGDASGPFHEALVQLSVMRSTFTRRD